MIIGGRGRKQVKGQQENRICSVVVRDDYVNVYETLGIRHLLSVQNCVKQFIHELLQIFFVSVSFSGVYSYCTTTC